MELRQLEYFMAVADDMSFTRAAQRVHVVQSALSTSIKKLEDELAVQLFDRSRQQIRLTPAGDEFRRHARQLLNAARLAKDALNDYRGQLTGTVEFGSLVTFGALDVPKVLGDFHAAHPFVRIRLRLSQSGSSSYLASIADGSLDLALVSAPDRYPAGIDLHLLAQEQMVFTCRADHPLAKRKRVGIEQLADENLVGFPEGFGIRRLIDDAFAAAALIPRILYEVPADFTVSAALIRNGLGTAFMPESEVGRFGDLVGIPLAAPIDWRIYLARSQREHVSPAAVRLADMLAAAAEVARRPSSS
ncbi:LysR family transcriptional regulator [Mycolicibacterium sediminis]|uniref:Probable hydrogen peroxide-inducible genes activator n=1 Tax=Mycolicibacterium sediminis TaxID=1286180 RepID=A0A7I7QM19_9MYCO|nr:LysR family transcriptional regulator [Mycolicibacterium sediminis]BBY27047.1 putative transcriptional regulator, LysR family protein [Mycolicibacterium sediminis]